PNAGANWTWQTPVRVEGDDAITSSITANALLQFVQAPNGGAWSHNQVDVTFKFFRAGQEIAVHTIRVARTNATLSAQTLDESGEPTTETIVGNNSSSLTLIVVHNGSGASASVPVSAVQGGAKGDKGDKGDPGAQGPEGPPGADGRIKQYVFRRSATQPSTPTGNGVPSGWSDTPPADNGQPLWTSVALQELDGTTVGSWSTPVRLDGEDGAAGAPGMNVARARIYRRSATTPSLPSSTATFTFATGAITGLNNGWTATIPAPDGNPLWISEATAASSGATDTIAPNEWASPVVLVQDGAHAASPLINGGFETGDTTGWAVADGVVVSSGQRSGSYCFRLNTGEGGPNLISKPWPVVPGEVWRFSAFVARDEANLPTNPAALRVRVYDSSGVNTARITLQSPDTQVSGYQALVGEYTVPAGAAYLAL